MYTFLERKWVTEIHFWYQILLKNADLLREKKNNNNNNNKNHTQNTFFGLKFFKQVNKIKFWVKYAQIEN